MHRAKRAPQPSRNANRIGRSMAGSRANVDVFLLGRDNGEKQPDDLEAMELTAYRREPLSTV